MNEKNFSFQVENKKALFDYEILDIVEVGIRLFGEEVKSIRNGQVNLKGSYVSIRGESIYLIGAHISPYIHGERKIDPKRERVIFMKKGQILNLMSRVREGGMTLVMTKLYPKGNLIKGTVALVRGKKTWQKKQILKERDLDRERSRLVKNYSL